MDMTKGMRRLVSSPTHIQCWALSDAQLFVAESRALQCADLMQEACSGASASSFL